jgi:membrane protein DedA with SNARE-associated domain
MNNFYRYLKPGVVPLMLAFFFGIFTVCYKTLDFPPPTEMADIGRNLYNQYGIVTLLIAAFIEGIFMVNIYFPGSFVIVLAVFLSDKTFFPLAVIAIVSWVAFMFSGCFNYWVGKTGFYKILLYLGKKDTVLNMQKWMDRRGKKAVFFAAIHPNFLAVSQVCLGIAQEGIKKNIYFSAVGLSFWVPIWTVFFALVVKKVNLEDSNQAWYIVAFFLVWALFLILKNIYIGQQNTERKY